MAREDQLQAAPPTPVAPPLPPPPPVTSEALEIAKAIERLLDGHAERRRRRATKA